MTMAKNKNAGKHPSYGNMSEDRRQKKIEYDKEYHATEERKRYRAELNKKNRDAGTYGNGDDKDMSHTKSGKLVSEAQNKNRARNGSGKNPKKK